MEKLDESYLDLVRESLYRNQPNVSTKHHTTRPKNSNKWKHKAGGNENFKNTVKEENFKNTVKEGFKTKKETFKAKAKLQNKSRKKIKPKEVTFVDNKPEISSPTESCSNVKHRVATPFKNVEAAVKLKKNKLLNLNESEDSKIVSIIAKTLSPSLNENHSITFYPASTQNCSYDLQAVGKNNNAKSKKRLLSEPDSPEVSVKRKKDKSFANKGKKLFVDDSLDDSELSKVANGDFDTGQNKKNILKIKKKIKNKPIETKLETIFTFDTVKNKAESILNNTYGNVIYSFKDDKNREKMKKATKKLKHKIKKTNSHKTNDKNGKNVNGIIALDNSHKTSTLGLEDSSEGLIIGSSTVDKKSNYKNGKQSKKSKKLKIKDIKFKESSVFYGDSLNHFSSSSDIEFNQKKNLTKSHYIGDEIEEVSDSCDNETVGVKGFKFQRFCNLFPPTHNEQFLGHDDALRIPKKYFKVSNNDFESGWQCEELPSLRSKIGSGSRSKKGSSSGRQKISNTSGKSEFENSSREKEVSVSEIKEISHLHSLNKKKEQKEMNILDVQILSNPAEYSVGGRDKETTEEVNFQESVDLAQTFEVVNHNSKREICNSLENFRQPVIITLKNEKKIVALNLGDKMHFHGLCMIKVLNGELEILGANMNSNSGEKKLYSPRGTALLYISNISRLFVDSSIKLNHLVSADLLYEKDAELTFEQHYAIFLCSELREPHLDFIEKYISQKIFPESSAQELRIDFKVQGNWNRIQSSEKWEEVVENITEDSKTVICGGKGVGKSTFLRYAVNFLLGRFQNIRVIDLDPGQSEFYPPGCISVVRVDREIFGPNYTHLLAPESLILSHIDMIYDIKKYLESVRCLLESTQSMEALPTLINFPGFVQGIGLDISVHSIKLVKPSFVIQIESKNHRRNYKVDMTADNVSRTLKENKTLSQVESNDDVDLSYDFVKFDSLAENNEAWSLQGRQGREINILSYFGKLMTDSISDLTSPDLNMYSISISALSMTNLEGKAISPLAINANVVALCSKFENESDILSCYGYGFVRGMDLQTDTLVLITPETIDTLEKVSHLVLSSVTTPPSLIMTASGMKGPIPYVSVRDELDIGQLTKRSYLPPQK